MQGVLDSQKQRNILPALATLCKQDLERTKKKFQIPYYIVKEELPIVKYHVGPRRETSGLMLVQPTVTTTLEACL